MAIPLGLTDITVHAQTPEDRAAYHEAYNRRDFEGAQAFRPALILHFGPRQVWIPTTTPALARACRQISELQADSASGRVTLGPPEIDDRPTAWAKVLASNSLDESVTHR